MFINKRLIPPSPDQWDAELQVDYAARKLSQLRLLRFALNTYCRSSLWAQMRRLIIPGQSVIDAGCGLGHWVWFLNRQGYPSQGMDFSEKMIRFLQNRFPELSWSVGLTQDMPFKDCAFDHLVSWGVIEHDPDGPDKALAEFFRVIRKGGYVFLTVPFDTPLQRTSMEVQYPSDIEGAVFFQYCFTPDDLRDVVNAHGFRVESIEPVSKYYGVIYPEERVRILKRPQFPNNIRARILNILASLRDDSYHMLLVVAQKL